MDASAKDSDPNRKPLDPERLDQAADGEASAADSVQAGQAAASVGDAVGPAMAPAGVDDDALLGALTAMSLDHAFIDHAVDQLTSSADLFDVPALHADECLLSSEGAGDS